MRFCRWIAQRASAQEGRGHAAEDDGRHAQPADGRHLVAEQQHAEQRREDDARVLQVGHHHGGAARVGARHAQLAQRSQDADGRQRLIEAINLVSADFKKILVITHLEELKDAFPARIEVEKTQHGSDVRVVAS